MRSLYVDDKADARMIGGVIGILITLIIAVLVFYNIAGSIDTSTIDANFDGNNGTFAGYATNASNATQDQAATFFAIAPIIAIVVVAVVILKYVGQI